jgi:hypothetical protein
MCYNILVHTLLQKTNSLKTVAWRVIACTAVILLLRPCNPGQAEEASTRYFPETGHYLKEPFLSFFETKGSLQAWGPPITEAIEENGYLVQYFRHARMECPTETPDPSKVALSPLGELLGYRTPRTAPVSNTLIGNGLCQYFTDTGHNVCFGFLTFYLDRGGSDIFGPPISELTVEPSMITQHFQRARIEWHMGTPMGAAVQLGAIGEEYFHVKGLDPNLLLPVELPTMPEAGDTRLTVRDYVRVIETDGVGLRFRTGAGLNFEEIEIIEEGTILRVVGGPEIADGFTWWYLDHHGSLGWCAEEWLERVEGPGFP